MKGNTRLYVVLLVVVLSLVVTGVALAQAITSYTGSIQLANLEDQQASIAVEFVPQSGVSSTFNYTIAGNGGLKLFPLSVTGPFNGSVIVSSDKKVTAVASVIGNTGGTDNLYYQGAYEGFDAGNSRVNVPLVQANNAGNFSWFNVQNTGSGAAVVNINFLPRDANMGSHRIANVSIDQGRAKTFKLSDYTAQLYGSAGKFVGSVVITTTSGEVAAVAVQENTTSQASIGAFDGFLGNAGSTEIIAPLLQFANGGGALFSAMNVQNVGTTTATVTATYSSPVCPGCTYNPVPEVKTIGPGKIGTFNLLEGSGQWVGGTAKRWVGGASVKSDGQPLVGVALQLRMNSAPKWTSVYDMFDPAVGTNKALAALLQFDNGQTYSSATVYNLGPDALQLQLTYSANTCGASCTFAPVPEVLTAPIGGVANFRMLEGATPQWTSTSAAQKRYVGSGTITKLSGTGPFVVVVNEQRLDTWGRPQPPGDSLKSYDAINVAP
jgi:hypothetical protein